ncbi:MAG: DNA repair protein RecO [Bacteroidota bacterium]
MSEIVKTEAIVLKAIKYRESSKIVTYFTKEHGKLSAIIKGARSSKQMFGTALEPMSRVSLVVYEKKGREIQTVTQCEVIRQQRNLFYNLEKMLVGMSIIELVRNIAHEQEKNVPLFELIATTLSEVNDATRNPLNLFYSFEISLADILGFGLSFEHCVWCEGKVDVHRTTDNKIEYHLEKGGPLCEKCNTLQGKKFALSMPALKILQFLANEKEVRKKVNLVIYKKQGLEIESFLFTYLRLHVTGVRSLKSMQALKNTLG